MIFELKNYLKNKFKLYEFFKFILKIVFTSARRIFFPVNYL